MKPTAHARRFAVAMLVASALTVSPSCVLGPATPADEVVPSPTPTAIPATATVIPAPTATPTATPAPASTDVQRIQLAPGATQAIVSGQLPASGRQRFVLRIERGQLVELTATPGSRGQDLRFSLTAAGGALIKPLGDPFIRTTAPATQDYYLDLISDAGAIAYTVQALIPERIPFESGATATRLTGSLPAGDSRHYLLHGREGQTMNLQTETTEGQVRVLVWGVDGAVLQSGMGDATDFEGVLDSTQDYVIAIQAGPDLPAAYTLRVTLPPVSPDP